MMAVHFLGKKPRGGVTIENVVFYKVDFKENCSRCDKHTTNRQGRGVLDQTEKTGADNIRSRVEVESITIARVGKPTI